MTGKTEAVLKSKASDTVRKYRMLENGDKVVVSVSGGPDSIALLLFLEELAPVMNLKLFVFHLDHMIRGEESKAEAEFVRLFSEARNIPVEVVSEKVKEEASSSGLSLQHFARNVRFARLSEYAERVGAHRIAVGHNADDQVETFLMRIIQGAGLKGFSGIPPTLGKIIRPLIETWRSEIEEYLDQKSVEPVIDSSNLEEIYLRNRVRHRLVPFLEEEFGQGIKFVILREVDSLAVDRDFLQERISDAFREVAQAAEGFVRIKINALLELHEAVRRGVIREAWSYLCPEGSGLLWSHVNDILEKVAGGKSGAAVQLPGGYVAQREYEDLVIRSIGSEMEEEARQPSFLEVPGSVELEKGYALTAEEVKASEVVFSDDSLIEYIMPETVLPMELRRPGEGDRFWPLGSDGMKKLKDYFIDIKLPRRKRDKVGVLTSGGAIVWVVGYRLDERFRLPLKSETAIKLEVKKV